MAYLNLNDGRRMDVQRAPEKKLGDQVVPKKKKRWDPVTAGRRGIALVEIVRDGDGRIEWRNGGKARWFTLKYTLEGSLNGRRVFERIVVEGAPAPVIAEGKAMMMSILSCHHRDIPETRSVGMLDGLRVPVQLYVDKRYGDQKPINRVHVLSPDPSHPRFGEYVALIRNQGMHVPGWDLWPDHGRVAKLVARRHMAEDVVQPETGEVLGERIVPSFDAMERAAAASARRFDDMVEGRIKCSGMLYDEDDLAAIRAMPEPEFVRPAPGNGLHWKQTHAESIRGTPENLAWFARHRLRPDFSSIDDADQHVRDWRAQKPATPKKEFK